MAETYEDLLAMSEDEAVEATRRQPAGATERLPYSRWADAQNLSALEDYYREKRDPAAILEALYLCAMSNFPIPEWCALAYIDAFREVKLRHNARSWGDVFGKPHSKGVNLSAQHDRWRWPIPVYQAVQTARGEGKAVDGHLFETIGRELGIGSKTKTEELYYLGVKRIEG